MSQLLIILGTAIASATPLVFASIGETITERAGIINLSAEGTMMLGALTGFAIAKTTGNLALGFLGAAVVGAIAALLVAFSSLALKQSQIAVGFVLALLLSDLSSFLGNDFVRVPGPTVSSFKLPILQEIPVFGALFFQSDLVVYGSYVLIVVTWIFFYRTRGGLLLRAIGERPEAAFARGIDVVGLRYLYSAIGGALIGIAGAAFSLDFKAGWSHRHTAGYGWIALAIAIFGGWHPLRVAAGAYLFGILQSLASIAQSVIPEVPTQVFSVAPFALMILALAIASGDFLDKLLSPLPLTWRRQLAQTLRTAPPASLGKLFERD